MLATEQKNFVQMLVALGEIYNRQVSPSLTDLYWKALEPFAFNEVVKAFEVHVRDPDSGQYMPKPADVIRAISGSSESKSLQAWTKVEHAIRLVGPYRSVVFDDPIIHAVLNEMGGWIKMGRIVEKEMPFVAKEFQTRFKSHRYKAPTTFPKYFAGVTEHRNSQIGVLVDPPMLIGDKTKAKAILQGSQGMLHLNQGQP